jgi:superfamily II DNA or RNA helicase
MSPLTITIKENLQLKNVPAELREMLVGKLQFLNPKWLENERMGRWNRGTPRLLKFYDKVGPSGLWIPRGYIRHLINLCRRQGVKFRIDDQRRKLEPVEFNFNGRLKHFQKIAVDEMLAKDFGTLSSATGSGKTVMALYIIARRKQPALIIVHTKDLAAQWVDAENIGFLVVDECHRCPSRTFTEAVSSFDSQFMLGLSATPYRRDKLSKLIFWHLGDQHHEVDKSQLIESGDVLPAKVTFRETNYTTRCDPVSEYSKMLKELAGDTERNKLIASDVVKEAARNSGICLVLSDRKAHCENLQALLRYGFKQESELLTGDLDIGDRQKVLERINRGQVKIIIATGQLIGEGFDCKDLTTLFLATPIKFSGRLLQYLGRVLRPATGKKYARVFDYVDVRVETLRKAANARQRVYRR